MKNHPNPIAFNPDTMTVSQLKACAETLRGLFGNLPLEEADPGRTLDTVKGAYEHMLRKWGDAS